MARAAALTLIALFGAAEAAPKPTKRPFAEFIDPALATRRPRPPKPLSIKLVIDCGPARSDRWLFDLRQRLARELGNTVMDRIAMSVIADCGSEVVVRFIGCEGIVEETPICVPTDEFAPVENPSALTIDLRCHSSAPRALAATIRARLARL